MLCYDFLVIYDRIIMGIWIKKFIGIFFDELLLIEVEFSDKIGLGIKIYKCI